MRIETMTSDVSFAPLNADESLGNNVRELRIVGFEKQECESDE